MTANINEAVHKIKLVGGSNVRIVPMPGNDALNGLQTIEIRENGSWSSVGTGVTKRIAEDIISQATNRVILG